MIITFKWYQSFKNIIIILLIIGAIISGILHLINKKADDSQPAPASAAAPQPPQPPIPPTVMRQAPISNTPPSPKRIVAPAQA